jgi:hypothetical protein
MPNRATPQEGTTVGSARSEIKQVDVGAESDVIGEIPAGMIGVVVEDDVVGVPEIGAITEIERRDLEEEAVAPESIQTCAAQAKDRELRACRNRRPPARFP